MGVMEALGRYADHPDRTTAMGNTVALLVASNGPFYPLYVWWVLPEAGLISCATMFASPFFAAIPWLARRQPALGRAAMPVLGLLNTIWTTALLGTESGVAVFVYPCLVLALLCWRERLTLIAVLGLGLAAQQWVLRWPWAPLSGLDAGAHASLVAMNAASVGMLIGFLVLMVARHARTTADKPSGQ